MTYKAAIGYMILAAQYALLEREGIEELEYLMLEMMDEHTEEEAEKEYYKF